MNKKDFYINNNYLFLNDVLLIKAKALIQDFLIINELIIVLLEPDDFDNDQNIFAYNLSNELIWQISELPKLHARNYFTSIYMNENNDLQAYSKNGVEVTINKDNGVIIKKELIK